MIKLFTSGMSHEQAVRWFKDQGRHEYESRRFNHRDVSYVCSKARTATGISGDKRKDIRKAVATEWYNQASCKINAWEY